MTRIKTRAPGREGLTVSALGPGCTGLSQGYGAADDRESIALVRRAVDLGVTLFDTAMSHGSGHNEELLGRAVAGRRDEVVLATEFGIARDADGTPTVQSEWSLWWRESEDDVVPTARRLGIGLVPYSPLGRGFPTGTVDPTTFGAGATVRTAGATTDEGARG